MRSNIVYLTEPTHVSMGEAWFEIASLEHFWIRRRFEVFRRLTAEVGWSGLKLGEVGSGTGLVQRQFEDAFAVEVDGFDLNIKALEKAVGRSSRCFCYDIHSRSKEMRNTYDWIILFDVLEHITDDSEFLDAALFHLKPGGSIAINVPAIPSLFSRYDEAVGHVRRYVASDLIRMVEACGATVDAWTYWGRPMLPLLRMRKRRLAKVVSDDAVLQDGFSSRNNWLNSALYALNRFERIPQQSEGTSLMLVAKRQ